MEQKDPTKLAEKLLESADNQTKGTWKIFVSISVVIVLLWYGSIDPLVPKLNALWDTSTASRSNLTKLENYKKKLAKGEESGDLLVQLKEKVTESLDARKKKIANTVIAFSIPGFPSLNVPTRYASTLWCVLTSALLYYLYSSRLTILRQLAMSARLLREIDPDKFPYRPASTFALIWWLTPLPKKDGESVSAEDFRSYIHASPSAIRASNAIVLLFLAFFILQIRVAMIASASVASLGNGSRFTNEDIVLIAITIFAVIITPTILFLWVRSIKVPDVLPPLRPEFHSRRRIIASGLSVVMLVTITTLAAVKKGPKTLVRWIRNPRFRYKRRGSYQECSLPQPGLYKNSKSNKFHYAMVATHTYKHSPLKRGDTFLVGVRVPKASRPNPQNFVSINDTELKDSDLKFFDSIAPQRRGYLMESLSNEFMKSNNNVDVSLRALMYAIESDLDDLQKGRRDSPNIRIYYLLARHALLSNKFKLFNEMIERIDQSRQKEKFLIAMKSWSNPNSRWRKRLFYVK